MASPAATPTPPPSTPNSGTSKPVFIPRRAADPLRRPAKRPATGTRPPPQPPTTTVPTSRPRTLTPSSSATVPPAAPAIVTPPDEPSSENKVDSLQGWQKFPLTTTKRQLLKDFRFHIMRLHSKHDFNPNNEEQFTRPIRLHRRDPRAPPQGAKEAAGLAAAQAEELSASMDPEEMAKSEAERAAKEAEKAATLAAIAPFGGAQKQKKNMFTKKTQQVFKQDEAAKKLRYEEYFPWHIEDFDNKNTWVGNLEGAMSDGTHAVLILEDAAFRMIPVEKWYKFTQQSHFQTLTIEEAESAMKMKSKPPRWLMQITKAEEKDLKAKEDQENQAAARRLLTVKGDRLAHRPKSEVADADEIDFDENFQDDEETPMMEGDEEENKNIEKRIRKEHLSANFFDSRGEKEWEEEEKERRQLELSRKKGGKKVRKYLKSLEKNATYETDDSDENPYLSESEDESTDEEEAAKRTEEEKKKAAEKAKADTEQKNEQKEPTPVLPDKNKAKDSDKAPTGALDKLKSPSKKTSAADTKLKASLKRSGADADLSGKESSTEAPSGRKKPPTSAPAMVAQPTQANKGPLKRTRDTIGSTASDTEGADGSGAENGKTKKQKVKLKVANTISKAADTPAIATRAGSPSAASTIAGGSRAASPGATSPGNTPAPGGNGTAGGSPPASLPSKASLINITADEIKAVLKIKPEGQTINEFLAHFKGRVAMDSYQEFLALLKPLTKQKGKLICPK